MRIKPRYTLQEVIRNTQAFRKRVAELPKGAINLDEFLYFKNNYFYTKKSTKHAAYNSVGCLSGWGSLWYGGSENRDKFLGLYDFPTPCFCYIFSCRIEINLTQRAEALKRLDTRLEELKKELMEVQPA